jgi:hypothetical protein
MKYKIFFTILFLLVISLLFYRYNDIKNIILNPKSDSVSTPSTPSTSNQDISVNESKAYKITKSITYNKVNVDVIIDKPDIKEVDVLITYHGTVQSDKEILSAAENTLNKFKNTLNRQDMMIVSVAHPQLNILFGENINQAEAALLWVKYLANQELGIKVKKIFLAGHSQGGYLVTRLNTMYETNGVIASSPGPLDLVFRCQLEESKKAPTSYVCDNLRNEYGPTSSNSSAYYNRSLLNFTKGFKSDILFVQGLDDSPIQMYSWPKFKKDISNCNDCLKSKFVEIEGKGHGALFESQKAKDEFNNFITSH